jgi:hypothetical protein
VSGDSRKVANKNIINLPTHFGSSQTPTGDLRKDHRNNVIRSDTGSDKKTPFLLYYSPCASLRSAR